jgi:hypothetical protein
MLQVISQLCISTGYEPRLAPIIKIKEIHIITIPITICQDSIKTLIKITTYLTEEYTPTGSGRTTYPSSLLQASIQWKAQLGYTPTCSGTTNISSLLQAPIKWKVKAIKLNQDIHPLAQAVLKDHLYT